MPLIEELPVTNPTRVSHGWAYVPEVAHPIASMTQPNSRKRQRNDIGTTNATATAKQQKAVQQRLESLGRENWKDGVSVPIPPRQGGKERKTKMTTNVRRILNYQKGFMHYLADEEAAAALNPGGSSAVSTYPGLTTTTGAGGRGEGKRKSIAVSETPISRRRSTNTEKDKDKTTTTTPSSRASRVKQEDTNNNTESNNTTTSASADTPASTPIPKPRPPYDPSYDTNPLLRTLNLPKKPSDRVLQILVTEPPLSYTAARAKPLPVIEDSGANLTVGQTLTSKLRAKPVRHFCAVCGYWGKVKCRKCGEWTCGIMECWKGHEAVCVALGMY